jgi:small redox-active disulfide protein 2
MKIAILGMGCPTCNKLEDMVKIAVMETGVDAEIDHVKDIKQIMAYGVMTTPALVVDGKVVAAGKIPTPVELKKIIGGK